MKNSLKKRSRRQTLRKSQLAGGVILGKVSWRKELS
jgi:hypothetical protein